MAGGVALFSGSLDLQPGEDVETVAEMTTGAVEAVCYRSGRNPPRVARGLVVFFPLASVNKTIGPEVQGGGEEMLTPSVTTG